MAVSELSSDADLKALKSYISDLFRGYYKKNLSILVMGKFGVGKSSLVNAIVGKPVSLHDGRSKRQNSKCAMETKQYFSDPIEGFVVQVWDSPGMQDGEEKDDLYLADIQEKTREIDLIIYCLKMDDKRFYPADKIAMKKLTEIFGKKLWEHSVIALTFANKVEDTSGGDQTTYFQDELEFWKDAIRSFFKNEVIPDHESLQSPPVCPTGYYREHRSLPICEDWLTKFWETCYNVIRSKGSFTLVKDKNSLPSWRIIKKRLLIMSVIGLGVTVVYIILNWLHPKKLSK